MKNPKWNPELKKFYWTKNYITKGQLNSRMTKDEIQISGLEEVKKISKKELKYFLER